MAATHVAWARGSTLDGRLESTELTVTVRDGIVARAGCVLLAADYAQLEMRILAHLSEDPELLRIFAQVSLLSQLPTSPCRWCDTTGTVILRRETILFWGSPPSCSTSPPWRCRSPNAITPRRCATGFSTGKVRASARELAMHQRPVSKTTLCE